MSLRRKVLRQDPRTHRLPRPRGWRQAGMRTALQVAEGGSRRSIGWRQMQALVKRAELAAT